MEEKIVCFKNLYDTYYAMGLPVSQIDATGDFTINNLKELHPQLPFKAIGFRPNYFSVLFVKKGKGKYTTDNKTFYTEPGTIYFTNPGHYKSFEWYTIDEVYLITFTESFLKENVHRDIFKEFPFLLSETVNPKTLVANEFKEFEQLYLQISEAYNSQSPYKKKITGGFFVVLLLKIKEHFWNDYNPIYEGSRSSQIVKSFKKNLETHYRQLVQGKADKVLRVQDYADMQTLHPNYLSNVIKSKTGKSISTWMAEKTITEA
ncbi:MAG: AraC family transcriptional regulator, partial [Bacteroidota bacterium]|nr:AraC family transcriptional regulator [Bacteroidota bacterium]